MALTRIQLTQINSQISGSSAVSDSLSAGSSLAQQQSLAGDLNALRSQLKRISGTSNWYDAVSGSQGLSNIYAFVRAGASPSDAAFQGAISSVGNASVGGTLGVTGAATFSSTLQAGASTLSSVTVSGATALNGGLTMDSNKFTVADGSGDTMIAGTLGVAGAVSLSGGAVISNLAVPGTGSFVGNLSTQGNATVAGTLAAGASTLSSVTVSGAAALNGGLTMDSNKFVVADGTGNTTIAGTLSVADAVSLSGGAVISNLAVPGTGSFVGALSTQGNASVGGTLGVTGAATFSSTLAAGASTLASAGITGNATVGGTLGVTGASSFSSATFSGIVDMNAALSASAIKIDGDTVGRLYVVGADGAMEDHGNLEYDGSQLKVTGNFLATGNAQINGDLLVKGAMTYIETSNMVVKDAFIYLATGSNGAVDSGLVLSKGAGASHDLVIGQDGGAGEVIFAKVAYNSSLDSPADLGGAQLVPAWMSEVKLGGVEDALSGSLKHNAAGIKLESAAGKEISVTAASELYLGANGFSLSLGSSAEYSAFDSAFAATSIVGALNELESAVQALEGSSNAKVVLTQANVNGSRELSWAASGYSLGTPSHDNVEVYLNGVLLAFGYDLESSVGSTKVTLVQALYDSLDADDVFVVCLRGV